jgi:hypothetical protein
MNTSRKTVTEIFEAHEIEYNIDNEGITLEGIWYNLKDSMLCSVTIKRLTENEYKFFVKANDGKIKLFVYADQKEE